MASWRELSVSASSGPSRAIVALLSVWQSIAHSAEDSIQHLMSSYDSLQVPLKLPESVLPGPLKSSIWRAFAPNGQEPVDPGERPDRRVSPWRPL